MRRKVTYLVLVGSALACAQPRDNNSRPATVAIGAQDVAMARAVIAKNTMSMPGLTPGSRFESGPGPFSTTDALVLYSLKLHARTRMCIPESALAGALGRVKDSDAHKKAAVMFWSDYCKSKDVDAYAAKPDGLRNGFQWYISTKYAASMKRGNARLEAQVRSDEAWRRAMDSDRKFREKSAEREETGRTAREAYLRVWNAGAAVAAAEAAVASKP